MRATASESRHWALRLALGVGLCALTWLASFSQPWHAAEFKLFDLLASWAPTPGRVPSVVILAVDEPTFQEVGLQWPFPRALHGRLLDRLSRDGAAAVGFDMVFSEPAPRAEDDAALARAVAAFPDRVVMAGTVEQLTGPNGTLWTEVLPRNVFTRAGARVGQVGLEPDDDYVVRRMPAGPDSFAAQVLRAARGSAMPTHDFAADSLRLLAYAGPRGRVETRSYYQALVPGLLPPGFFRDRIVLIGRSVRSADELRGSHADMFNSPFAWADGQDRLMPGVEIQANILHNLAEGTAFQVAGDLSAYVVLALALVSLTLVYRRWHPAAAIGLSLGWFVGVGAASAGLLIQARVWWSPLWLMASLLLVSAALSVLDFFSSRRQARNIRRMFAQYVPPDVVSRLVEQPESFRLGGESRAVTLLFTDLAGFTALSERLSPEQTVDLLTEYFGIMTQCIHRQGGTVDKFIGDAIMAFWGAPLPDPKQAEHAVQAARDMQAALTELTQRLVQRGLPPIAMRIGLHSGTVVVGNVGSATRFSYTAIGDAVNLASRLEGANKAFGTTVLISDATVRQLPAGTSGLRALDSLIVQGKTESVDVWTVCDDAVAIRLSAEGLAAFRQRRWDAAEASFTALLQRIPGDAASTRLLARITQSRALAPGADWNPAVALDKL